MNDYNDAITGLLEAITGWDADHGWSEKYIAAGVSLRSLSAPLITDLKSCEPYYVSAVLSHVLIGASEDYPTVPLLREDLPSQSGWVYFGSPLTLPGIGEDNANIDITAIHWGAVNGERMLWGYERRWQRMYPICNTPWDYGQTWNEDDFHTNPEWRVGMKSIHRLWHTFLAFIRQAIFIPARQKPLRAVSRRAMKKLAVHDPLIKVILLRKAQQASYDGGYSQGVEWACRWLVRGHWRQQWYSSTGVRRAIFISPYVKGPEDKPLKRPASVLFNVAR